MVLAPLALFFQATWVVNSSGGPGVSFTDIPPAIAAAADGDILLVQPGTYSHFMLTGKGLRILGSGSTTTFVGLTTASAATTISNLPSTSFAYVDGVRFQGYPGPSFVVEVEGASTNVVLSDVAVLGATSATALQVEAANLWAMRCSIQGGNGGPSCFGATSGGPALLALNGALVHVSGSTLQGGNGGGGCFTGTGGSGSAGAELQGGSQVWIADSIVRGGGAGCCSSAASSPCGSGGTAIYVTSSILRVSGDASSLVQGGQGALFIGLPPASPSGYGIATAGASAVTVHSVPVLGGCTMLATCNPGPAISGTGITLDAPPLPVLDVSGTMTLTGTATVSLANGPPSEPFLLAFAGASAYLSAGSLFLGEILLDPVNWYPLFSGVLSAAGEFVATIPLSGIDPSFTYFPVYLQGIALDPSGTFWRVSNSTVATIRP